MKLMPAIASVSFISFERRRPDKTVGRKKTSHRHRLWLVFVYAARQPRIKSN
jgi:hypothetical protein